MNRVKIEMPEGFSFSTTIPVRITDVNYGGHVGNDAILSIIHEARAQFFIHLGYTELNLAGAGLIMSDVIVEFKNELFYGEMIKASVIAGNISKISFDLFYKLEKETNKGILIPVVFAKTGMVCYDYANKKIILIPEEIRSKLINQQ